MEVLDIFLRYPRQSLRLLHMLRFVFRGIRYARGWDVAAVHKTASPGLDNQRASRPPHPLKSFFDSHQEGRSTYKWTHDFDIYLRHFSRFIGRDVHGGLQNMRGCRRVAAITLKSPHLIT